MKKLFLLLSLGLSVVAFYSCNDDDNPVDEIPEELVIQKDADAANYVKGIFKTQNAGSGYSFLLESASEATISFEGEDTEDGPLVSQFDIDPNNGYVSWIWSRQYEAVAAANIAIEKISDIPAGEGEILSEYGKNTALGGAYFVRGLAYFYLVQLWGEVPLYTSTANATGGDRAPVSAIYAQIEADLKKAEELFPEKTSFKSEPNKYAADAVLSRVYLTWATLTTTPDNTKFANAVTYADKVINSKQYALLSDIIQNWGRYNKNGQEHIYTISYVLGEDGPNDGGNHQSHCAFSYGFDADPNTQPPHIGPSSITLYDRWNDADQRKEFSYTAHLLKPHTDQVYTFLPPRTLPVFGKGIDRSFEDGPLVGPSERDMDRIELRYAEVLLIKAEALIESNQKLAEARSLINEIRHRAYRLGAYADPQHPAAVTEDEVDIPATANQAELRDALREERFNEFVYEQKRWLDLVRWHNLAETVKTVATFPEYTETYAPGSFFAKVQKHLKAKYAAITANPTKYYRFPIPETAIETNSTLTQNPGY
ncbi:RagB/SusD family nutrient uptake outer membrane protein [termite gut metagenome]|uniref:RagB/SusD family nutrient uptake outer membrane protein n=1 Tax=termite gut metagenome TaxID=433724 RepID=A0A5J4SQI2_9ZZZZ